MLSSSAGEMPLSSGSYGQMSEMIRAKERELQQFQDMRNAQLEEMIVDRDKLLLESTKRYDQLKDDFEYNLTLIDARDKEIERLERAVADREYERDELQQQLRSLSVRLEVVQQKESERVQKMELDKQSNKVSNAPHSTRRVPSLIPSFLLLLSFAFAFSYHHVIMLAFTHTHSLSHSHWRCLLSFHRSPPENSGGAEGGDRVASVER
jgi:uncharacterized coiled-coil protein SlyX